MKLARIRVDGGVAVAVGELAPGDGVECEVDGIGTLRNPVVAC